MGTRALDRIFTPKSLALVGASPRPDSSGRALFDNIVGAGFKGEISLINPRYEEIEGRPCLRALADLSAPPDLLVMAAPAEHTLAQMEEAERLGVPGALVMTRDPEGWRGGEMTDGLRKIAQRGRMRIVGPNCLGMLVPRAGLNASLSAQQAPVGDLAVVSQSGAIGAALLAWAHKRHVGFSGMVSAGEMVDVDFGDLLDYFALDVATRAILLYIDRLEDAQKFMSAARAAARVKPVIVVKSGAYLLGSAPGHFTRTTSVRQEAFDALLRQSGVIRTENIHQLFDVAQLVVHQSLPAGDRVAVVTNSDALGSLTSQAAQSWDLKVTHGPVSVPPEAGADEFAQALRAAFDDPQVDTVIASFIPPIYTDDELVAAAVREEARRSTKTCTATFLGMRGVTEQLALSSPGSHRRVVPAYPMPEDAVRAVAAATRYAQWKARDKGTPVAPTGIDQAAVETMIDAILAEHPEGRALTQPECIEMLAAYGISLWPDETVSTADEAVAAADRVGYPVILKAISPAVRHQVGVTGIRPDLTSQEAVRDAHASLVSRLGAFVADRFAVQRMSPPGVSCVVGSAEDPLFGPVVSFSIAGPPTDLLGDIGYRIPPLTNVDVDDLLFSVKAAPLLTGHRGKEPVDLDELRDLLARVSVLADNHSALQSVSLQPVNCWGSGVDVLGAEIVVAPAMTRKDASRRAMT